MKENEIKKGVRVLVEAAATGDGVTHLGTIEAVTKFFGRLFVDVLFDKPTADGRRGISMSNLDMIRKLRKGDKSNEYSVI